MNPLPPRSRHRRIAIVGAGFSGALLALNLVRHGVPGVTLVERRAAAGRGVAYAAASERLLLNVRAANMSAFPHEADHFLRWLEAHGGGDGGSFVSRARYGDYLAQLLSSALELSHGQAEIVVDDAVALELAAGRPRLVLASGRAIAADAVVVATGNLPPSTPNIHGLEALPPDLFARDPWSPVALAGLGSEDVVLAIGTGLTMVDTALVAVREVGVAKVIGLSRRGLVPRVHGAAAAVDPLGERPAACATRLLRKVRAETREIGWRAAVDRLRPVTQDLWRAAELDERRRFLRHLRPWWDVHRHRLAPAVGAEIEQARAAGRLEVHAGGMIAVEPVGSAVRVVWRARGEAERRTMTVRRIVNCTGAQSDLAQIADPFLRSLRDGGWIRPDPLRLGIELDSSWRAVSAAGEVTPWLMAIGPITRAALWEAVAVPDIRMQAWSLARRLSNAQWVEGEGL